MLDDIGVVSGFVLRHSDEATLYLAGDTILFDPVIDTLRDHRPDAVVVHAAGAEWRGYSPIVIDEQQVATVLAISPRAAVIATHLDAVDHATVTRSSLKKSVRGLSSDDAARLQIPDDGETMVFLR